MSPTGPVDPPPAEVPDADPASESRLGAVPSGPGNGRTPSSPLVRAVRWAQARYVRARAWKGFAHPWAPSLGLCLSVVAFSGFIGWVYATRYWAFLTAAWDLGVYHQAFYTTVFDHRFFYYTADLPAGTNGYLFSAHFSPFLFLLLPFYAVAASPSALLVIQAAGLGLGAIPVYYLARLRLGPGGWPALLAAAYLLYPLTIGTGWYDFHPEAFLPVTGLATFYFYERGRLYPFLAALLLSLSVIETMAPFLLVFAGVGLVAAFSRRSRLGPEAFQKELRLCGLAAVVTFGWLLLSVWVTFSLSPNGGTFGTGYGGGWSILGASSILDVYPRALLAPGAAVAALAHDLGLKALYLALVFGGLGGLTFFGRVRYQLPAFAWVGLALLSNHTGYYVVNDQYTGYLLPFLFPAVITGVERWRTIPWRPYRLGLRSPALAGVLVVSILVTTGVCSPFLAQPYDSFNAVEHGVPLVTAHDTLLHRVIGLIPPGAAVVTSAFLFPEVSNRADAYVTPVSSLFVHPLTFQGVVDQYVNESRFVLVDYEVDFMGAVLLVRSANLSGFGLEAAAEGAYLYARGWTGPPAIWVPFSKVVAGGSLTPGLGVVDRADRSPYGPTLLHAPGNTTGLFWDGPVVQLVPPGTYEVRALVEVNAESSGPQSGFTVLETPSQVSETVTPVGSTGQTYSFSIERLPGPPLVLANDTAAWNGSGPSEFAVNYSEPIHWTGPGYLRAEGWVLSGSATERLEWVSFSQISPG